jgi:hypothetical protein
MKCPTCGYKMQFCGEIDSSTDLFLCKSCVKEVPVSKDYKEHLDFILVNGENDGESWQGIYINGVLMEENHKLDVKTVIRLLIRNGAKGEIYNITNKRFWNKHGSLPKQFAEIPNKILE